MEPMKLDKAAWAPMSTSFNPNKVTEFIPKGKMVNTAEQFPDLNDMDDAPKGGKKTAGKKGKKKTVTTAPIV